MAADQTVSIIMPAYNSEKYVAEAIESVICQTYTDWELLAIDDGSTDNTGKILDSYEADDCRIRVFHTENKGVSHARNTGLDNADGEWIAFLDSDDMLPPDALTVMIENSAGCDLVMGNYELYPVNNSHMTIEEAKTFNGFRELEPDFISYLYASLFSVVWGKLFRRNAVKIRFEEEIINCEDVLFFALMIGELKKTATVTDTVYIYRKTGEESLSRQYSETFVTVHETAFDIYKDFFDSHAITSGMYIWYLCAVISAIRNSFRCAELNDDDRRKIIQSLCESDFFRCIPVKKYPFTTGTQRKVAVLQIGDIDMIMNEFSGENAGR